MVIVPDLAATGYGGGQPVAQLGPRSRLRGPAAGRGRGSRLSPISPWKLWQVQSDLEEWQEDLRTLYVACTRARDYLILSSSLPDGVSAGRPLDADAGRALRPGDGPLPRGGRGGASGGRPCCVHDRRRPPPPAPPAPPRSASRPRRRAADGRAAAFVDVAAGRRRRLVSAAELAAQPALPRRARFCDPCWRPGISASRTDGGRRCSASRQEGDLEDIETILKAIRRIGDAPPAGGGARLSARGGVFPQPHPRRRRRGRDAARSPAASIACGGRRTAAGGCCSSPWRRPRNANRSGGTAAGNGAGGGGRPRADGQMAGRRRPAFPERRRHVERAPGRLSHRRILAAAAAELRPGDRKLGGLTGPARERGSPSNPSLHARAGHPGRTNTS